MVSNSSSPPYYKSLVYGGMAHGLEVLMFGHVLDRIKVQYEAQGGGKSITSVFNQIVGNNGLRSLYKGVKWNFLLSAVKGSQGWAFNNMANRLVSATAPPLQSHSFLFTLNISVTTAVLESLFFITPFERLKTIEMTSKESPPVSPKKYFQLYGPKFFFVGLPTVILRQSVTWTSYLGFYDLYKGLFEKNQLLTTNSLRDRASIGALTGASVCLINAPVDFYKTQKQMLHSLPEKSMFKNLHYLKDKYGLTAFYSNLQVKILRSSMSCAFILSFLDYTRALPTSMQTNFEALGEQ